MENEAAFLRFLKRKGRSADVAQRVLRLVNEFEQFLLGQGKTLDQASPREVNAFVNQIEAKPGTSAKTHLWAIIYYYEFTSNETIRKAAGELRRGRIERNSFPLKKFKDINPDNISRLEEAGIRNCDRMLAAGRTPADRQALADKTGVPVENILELVKLSDLSRLMGLKGIRARLYYAVGADTPEMIAQCDVEELRLRMIAYVAQTGFEGIAPLPKEVQSTVAEAMTMPKIVEY